MLKTLARDCDAKFTEVTGLPKMPIGPTKPHIEHPHGETFRDLANLCGSVLEKMELEAEEHQEFPTGASITEMASIDYAVRVRDALQKGVQLEGYESHMVSGFASGTQDLFKVLWALIDSYHHQYNHWPSHEEIQSWTPTCQSLSKLMARFPSDTMNTACTFEKILPERPRSSDFQHLTRTPYPFRFDDSGEPILQDDVRKQIVTTFGELLRIVCIKRNSGAFTTKQSLRKKIEKSLLNRLCPARGVLPIFVDGLVKVFALEYREAIARATDEELDDLLKYFRENTKKNLPRHKGLELVVQDDATKAQNARARERLYQAYMENNQPTCPIAAIRGFFRRRRS